MKSPSSPDPTVRPRFTSLADIGTTKVRQLLAGSHTMIIRGLWRLSPRRRRSKLPWVLLAALAVVGGLLFKDPSTREYLVGRASPHVARAVASIVPGANGSAGDEESPSSQQRVSWPSAEGVQQVPPPAAESATRAPPSAAAEKPLDPPAPPSVALPPPPAPAAAPRPRAKATRASSRPSPTTSIVGHPRRPAVGG